jgi:hypothetical protein
MEKGKKADKRQPQIAKHIADAKPVKFGHSSAAGYRLLKQSAQVYPVKPYSPRLEAFANKFRNATR